MKIAIIHHQLAKRGGMESYLFDLITGFTRRGMEVTVFTYQVDKHLSLPALCRVHKYNLSWCPKFLRKFYFIHKINQSFNAGDFDLSLNLTRTASQDISVSGGTHPGFLHSMQKKLRLKDRLEIYFEKKSFMLAPQIVAHSLILKKEIQHFYAIDDQKITLIYPPIDHKKFHIARTQKTDSVANKWGINPHKTTLLFPSTGHKRKGLFELLEAMTLLPEQDYELLIAGNPATGGAIPTNVRYLGFVENMAELYVAVDYTILPSHYEPFGLVAIESIQCGTPVILSEHVGAKDLISPKEGVIIAGTVTAEKIAAAILAAKQTHFAIDADFIESKNLTIDAHIDQMMMLGQKH